MSKNSKFSARPSLLGYIYQCRIALLETLKRLKINPRLVVAIETLDDVVFEKDGSPAEIIQVKHHINREANLTDASTDLWGTIRIWCDLFGEGVIQHGAVFCMITTAQAVSDSAAYYLRSETRDLDEAIKRLTHTAITSGSASNKEAYDKFLSLSTREKQAIFQSALIIDSSPSTADVSGLLQQEIWPACERGKSEQFLNYLEGWWLRRIVQSLLSPTARQILAEEIDACLNGLREQFKSDNLPIHEDLKTARADLDLFQNRIFVQQLKLIEIGPKRIAMAVNNYYRAFEQRSRWLREDLLIIGDLET